jgi:hypothetical protein
MWVKDVKCGQGKMDFANGDKYDGDHDADKANGHGKMAYANGDHYEGDWEDGHNHGHGTMVYANGDIYTGEFEISARVDGPGSSFLSESGDDFAGYFVMEKRHGHGVQKFDDGEFYDGEWVDDKMEGMGTLTYVNGNCFTGMYKAGKRADGPGTMVYKEDGKAGDVYTGQWVSEMEQGDGVMEYNNGNMYKGEWKVGMREGQGSQLYKTTDRYTGQWAHDVRQGFGIYTVKEKIINRAVYFEDKYEGDWVEDQWTGQGEITFKSDAKLRFEWHKNPQKRDMDYPETIAPGCH